MERGKITIILEQALTIDGKSRYDVANRVVTYNIQKVWIEEYAPSFIKKYQLCYKDDATDKGIITSGPYCIGPLRKARREIAKRIRRGEKIIRLRGDWYEFRVKCALLTDD